MTASDRRGSLGRQRTALALRLRRDPSDSRRWERLFKLMEWLVREKARCYLGLAGRAVDMDDLMQAGRFGLARAVETFDRRRGNAFATHATYTVWNEIQKCAAADRAICVPLQLRLAVYRGKPSTRFDDEHNEAAFAAETARFAGPDFDVPDRPRAGAEDFEEAARSTSRLGAWLDQLNDRDRDVIAGRFGLGGRERETLDQIGRRLGLTRERVRQIELRALARIREMASVA